MDEYREKLDQIFPVEGTVARMFCVSVEEREQALYATLQLHVYEDGMIRDIKEQDVRIAVAAALLRRDIFPAFARAYRQLLQRVLDGPIEVVEVLMPYDLWFDDVLKQSRPKTQADFEKALLTKRRFGQLLAAS